MQHPPFKAVKALTAALVLALPPALAGAQAVHEFRVQKPGLVVTVGGSDAGQEPSNPAPVDPPPSGTPLAELSATAIVWDPLLTPVAVGSSDAQSVLLLNQGTAGLGLLKPPALTGSGEFTAETACSSALKAGTSCSTTVTYAPISTSPAQGTLSFETAVGTKTVTLTGTPAYPVASISASAGTSFGSVVTGTSKSLSFTVTSTGTMPMAQVYVKVANASVTMNSSCGTEAAPLQALAKGGSCAVTLTWTPTVTGALSTALEVFASGASIAQQALTGTGSSPATVKLQAGGFRTWSDGTLASSCKNYLTPLNPTAYSYQGDTGSGVYKILPAGQTETLVYCDMTTAGGGWTLIGKYTQWGGALLEVRSVLLRGAAIQGWSNAASTHPAYKGNNVFQEIRYTTANATWNAKYGVTAANGIKFATWAAWPTITSPSQWVVNAKRLDGTSTPALASIASHAAAWWASKPVEQTRQGRGIELSLFTVPSNTGECGGENTVGYDKICGVTGFWSNGSYHYDVVSEKWLMGR